MVGAGVLLPWPVASPAALGRRRGGGDGENAGPARIGQLLKHGPVTKRQKGNTIPACSYSLVGVTIRLPELLAPNLPVSGDPDHGKYCLKRGDLLRW